MGMFKMTLSTGKVIVVREMTISLKNTAIEIASNKAPNGGPQFQALLQDELLRTTIVSVDGNKLSGADKEDFDKIFTGGISEYNEAMNGMSEAAGINTQKKPKIEFLTGE